MKNKLKLIKDKIRFLLSKKIYLSFGENCLSDNILDRHNLKSFTTPFSHGRSNIEYILQLEKDNYKDFLNINYLHYEEYKGALLVRLKKYNVIQNTYNQMHVNGMEFTHHDVIKSDKLREIFKNRVARLQKHIGKKKYVILYHNRYQPTNNFERLISDLLELKVLYSRGDKNAEVVLYTQEIVNSDKEREVNYRNYKNIHWFNFKTLNLWEGDDDNLLWARFDDDLIRKMIVKIKSL